MFHLSSNGHWERQKFGSVKERRVSRCFKIGEGPHFSYSFLDFQVLHSLAPLLGDFKLSRDYDMAEVFDLLCEETKFS